ncbi:hypothetical protein GCM10011405_08270 [Rufibacter glacialis]|nr:hypothetical protein GCM10011405_08270 [Rufibacter glacialis]
MPEAEGMSGNGTFWLMTALGWVAAESEEWQPAEKAVTDMKRQ